MTQTAKIHVAYVDDDPLLLQVAKSVLERTGDFEVTCFQDPMDARARIPALRPNLLLLDVVMPGLDGLSLMWQLRDSIDFHSAPIVLITANTDEDDLAHFRRAGADDIVTKPFDPTELAAVLHRAHESNKEPSHH